MNDMTMTVVPKSDQINADDLIGGPITIQVSRVVIGESAEQPVSVFFEGSQKPYRPCKQMRRVMIHCWGSDAKVYAGRRMTLYRDPTVKYGGFEVGGIRISHMSDIDAEKVMALTVTKAQRRPFTVKPLRDAPPVQDTPKPDRATATTDALIEATRTAPDLAALLANVDFDKRRTWLRENRRELAARLEAAIAEAEGRVAPGQDTEAGA